MSVLVKEQLKDEITWAIAKIGSIKTLPMMKDALEAAERGFRDKTSHLKGAELREVSNLFHNQLRDVATIYLIGVLEHRGLTPSVDQVKGLYNIAYENGHSGGYSEIVEELYDLVEVAVLFSKGA